MARKPVWDMGKRGGEVTALACVGVLYFGLRLYQLRNTPLNSSYDEGVYLAIIKLLAGARARIYRDIVEVHPPGVFWAGAAVWRIAHGDLFAVRAAYILFCSVACIPTYLLIRRLCGVRAALWTLLLIAITPGYCTWLGRLFMLDLSVQVPLYTALWILLCFGSRSIAAPIAAGLVVGLADIVKETAITSGLALCIALFVASGRKRAAARDGKQHGSGAAGSIADVQLHPFAAPLFTAAFVAGLAFITIMLARIPHYMLDAYGLKPGFGRRPRAIPYELTNGFYMLPLQLTFGVAGAWRMVRGGSTAGVVLGAFALINSLMMVFLPPVFYWRYLMPGMPVLTLGVVLGVQRYLAGSRPGGIGRAVAAILFALFSLVGLICGAGYFVKDMWSPPAYAAALAALRGAPEPVFSADPIWLIAAGKSPPEWPLAADAVWYVPGESREVSFAKAIGASPTVVLDHVSLQLTPPAALARIRRDYRTVFKYQTETDRKYVEILLRR